MKKIFQFPGGVHANSFDAGPLVTALMWVIREAAGACIASRAYPVPTNQTGEYSINDIAREVVRVLEADKRAAGL